MASMRAALLLLIIAGCGRFHFDAGDGRDGGPDALPVACVEVGAACDDLDICTSASACDANLVCVGTAAMEPCTVASSIDDFSMVQGDRGWYYGYWIESSDANGVYEPATDFSSFVWMDAVWEPPDWQATGPDFTWAYLHWWGGHPGSYPTHKLPVRRWVSSVSGHAEVEVHHAKADLGGDGTRAILIVDGVTLLSRDIAGDDATGFVEVVPIELAIGSTVDLMIHYIGDDGVDTTNSSMIIRSR